MHWVHTGSRSPQQPPCCREVCPPKPWSEIYLGPCHWDGGSWWSQGPELPKKLHCEERKPEPRQAQDAWQWWLGPGSQALNLPWLSPHSTPLVAARRSIHPSKPWAIFLILKKYLKTISIGIWKLYLFVGYYVIFHYIYTLYNGQSNYVSYLTFICSWKYKKHPIFYFLNREIQHIKFTCSNPVVQWESRTTYSYASITWYLLINIFPSISFLFGYHRYILKFFETVCLLDSIYEII